MNFKEDVLHSLNCYRTSMSEFSIEEMDYLIHLVRKDIDG